MQKSTANAIQKVLRLNKHLERLGIICKVCLNNGFTDDSSRKLYCFKVRYFVTHPVA